MKRRKRKQSRAISTGTIAMLLLTAAVLLSCAGFMVLIAGEALFSRADEAVQMVRDAGVTLISEEERAQRIREEQKPAASMTAAPTANVIMETPQPRTMSVSTFTIAAAGTVHAPKAVRTGALSDAGEYDFTPVFDGLGNVLAKADLAIATLETMTAGEKKGYGNYNAPVQLLDALRKTGVDVVSLGTERALDKGYDGLQITMSELTARGITHTGVSLDAQAASRTQLMGIGGVQVAVLGYTYGLSRESKENAAPSEWETVSTLDTGRVVEQIRQARADGANVVIVLPHWGTKNKQETPEDVRRMARTLAQAGADVILGTHPNVVQGTERLTVTRTDGLEYESVVCYSLGSLLTDARTDENTAGMIAHLSISYDPQTRRVTLGSLACLPVYIAREKEDGENIYRVIDVENAEAMEKLSEGERQEAHAAAERVRKITGQSDMEDEGQG